MFAGIILWHLHVLKSKLAESTLKTGDFMIFTVQQILDKKDSKIFTTTPDNTVQEAIELMAEKNFGALPVMVDDKMVGIISERDYIRKAAPKRLLPWELRVNELMTTDVLSVTANESINDCLKTMSSKHIRHLPVVEEDRLVGFISITDVVSALRSARFIFD